MTDIINWKAELKKIEREYDTHGASGRTSGNSITATRLTPEELANGAMVRIGLSAAVSIGILFWPYAHECGSAFFSYLGAAVVVVIGGLWSVFWTWRGRMGRCHALSLVIVLWGLIVSATQVLPRAGHITFAGSGPPGGWFCPGNSPREIIKEIRNTH